MKNETYEDQFCKVSLDLAEHRKELSAGITVSPGATLLLNKPLENPKQSVVAKVIAECRPLMQAALSE